MVLKEPNCKVWTPEPIVSLMLDMLPTGRILEPSVGMGAFLKHLPIDAIGVEIDPNLYQDSRIKYIDFFRYSADEKFDGVIMNPPYLRAKHIPVTTKLYLPPLSGHANLAYHFVWKSIDHLKPNGVIVAILPEEIFRATGAVELNKRMYLEGAITHMVRLKKSPFLPEISQEVVIIRWQKDNFTHTTEVTYA